tara:strand:+ start:175 stop:399 length:225 start_codon:yes stop_codon:yes gene_type:complete
MIVVDTSDATVGALHAAGFCGAGLDFVAGRGSPSDQVNRIARSGQHEQIFNDPMHRDRPQRIPVGHPARHYGFG